MSNTTYLITLPRNRESIEEVWLLNWMFKNDIHKWIIAKETGNDGYKHWQIRLRSRYDWNKMKEEFGEKAHIEEASDEWNYERKEGNFIKSDDNTNILGIRYGRLRDNQRRILDEADKTDDRGIVSVVDYNGASGKTWLAVKLHETGRGFYVPPTISNSQGIIQYVASGYNGEEYIVIDIPRSTKWTNQLYVAVETIKDGLVYDTRYHTTIRNIRGVKVIVFCNTKPNLSKLSKDRWRLLDANGEPLT